jgi:hypothetical protein
LSSHNGQNVQNLRIKNKKIKIPCVVIGPLFVYQPNGKWMDNKLNGWNIQSMDERPLAR